MCDRLCGRLCDRVRPCAVKISFVRPCAVIRASVYERVRPCTAVFEQNICAMMLDHVLPCAVMSDRVRAWSSDLVKLFFRKVHVL